MSQVQVDAETLGRLLGRVGATVAVGDGGATVTAPGWEARIERLDLGGVVRLGGIALRVGGVRLGADGVVVTFGVE
jgi:hypothetical protein